jgi:hypothetical protein
MFTCSVRNTKNQTLTLTQDEPNFQLYDIVGLNPTHAQINTAKVAGLDGAKFNSAVLETKNLVLYIKINGSIEQNRLLLYRFFPTKEKCTIFFKNDSRDVYIDGYVETVEVTPFSNREVMQVSILCPFPYFKAVEEVIDDISKANPLFVFPFSFGSKGATNPHVAKDASTDPAIPFSTINNTKITDVYNDSESETGVRIDITVLKAVNKILIRNTETGETFTLKGSFLENDHVVINTNKGEKAVVLIRNGVRSNIFTWMVKGSAFFQLSIGDNYFSFLVDDGVNDAFVSIAFRHYTLYRGV